MARACRQWAGEFTWGKTGAAMTRLVAGELDRLPARTPGDGPVKSGSVKSRPETGSEKSRPQKSGAEKSGPEKSGPETGSVKSRSEKS